MSASGHKCTFGSAIAKVRFTPRKRTYAVQLLDVRIVPIADSCTAAKKSLLDHLVGCHKQRCGTLRPSVFAVLRLMTNSNLVDCMTGRSAGFAPLRMRPA